MKRRKKKLGCALISIIFVVAGIFGIYFAWKYYILPERPDHRTSETVEKRSITALEYVRKHNMNEHYALFVDYSIPSGTPRLFVWDFQKNEIITSTYVMHGYGGGSTDKRPHFSNKSGSKCSSLGKFLVTKEHGRYNKHGFRLKGLENSNSNAYDRWLMIHSAGWVNSHCWMQYIPLNKGACEGCVTITTRGQDFLYPLIKREEKPLLLWSYN